MFRFQVEIGAALIASAVSSSVALYWSKKSGEGKIRLPVHGDGEHPQHDPLDVTTPTDLIDGYPIDEEKFWRKMRWRKLFITSLLAFTVALNGVALGFSYIEGYREAVIIALLQLVFSIYILVLSARSVVQDNVEAHSQSVIHLSLLTLAAALLLISVAIMPDTPPPVIKSLRVLDNTLDGVWYGVTALYSVACVVVFTTPQGPPLRYPADEVYSTKTVQAITNPDPENVCGLVGASPWDTLMFSYTTKVVWLGNLAQSLEIGDLPILPADMRAVLNYHNLRDALRKYQMRFFGRSPQPGSGWNLIYKLCRLNATALTVEVLLAGVSACLFYAPAFFMRRLIAYLESDKERQNQGWGWAFVFGLFVSNCIGFLFTAQLWSLATTTVQVRLKIQLNTVLFSKTLVRKDVASSAASNSAPTKDASGGEVKPAEDDQDDFSSKAQIMNLMTTDVDRVSDFAWHLFTLVDSPIELLIGTVFLYDLLGVSCLFGLAVICLFLPLNHFAGKIFVRAQEGLMKSRDQRVALMNEILGGIRMLKFMAWERSFEKRILTIRERELGFQKLHYRIETVWNALWNGSPIIVTLVTFWHYAIVRGQPLTPSIAFTSIIVFTEMKFALNALPETFINMLQCFVSLRRVEKYLNGAEVNAVPPLEVQSREIAFKSCTVTWAQDRSPNSNASSAAPSGASTPRHKFILVDLNLNFPRGELSLICGKLGSGKTLLLLSLLGEADVLSGRILCPRSPPDGLAKYSQAGIKKEDWIVEGMCAYVPQATWLRNASIKENILFTLPYDEERYQKTLEACALVTDLEILEDGDESEIGERGVNLSGGQKARVSLARAIYSRASVLFLDDVLSAVDAHTAHHLYHHCLKGELMQGRTVILISHHVQLCASGASYIVALENGRILFEGNQQAFNSSGVIGSLGQTSDNEPKEDAEEKFKLIEVEDKVLGHSEGEQSETSSTAAASSIAQKKEKKPARKLIEEETRAVGRIKKDIWTTFLKACGNKWYWLLFGVSIVLGSVVPVLENTWLKFWSASALNGGGESPAYYISVYAIITTIGLVITTTRWIILYDGSIRASTVLYKRLLETVLFADIRFHDTVSRGRLLNRFGKDFEGIDSSLADNFGRTAFTAVSAFTTIITVSVVGGIPFILTIMALGVLYYNAAKIYGQTSRDMRRLDSVSRSPLYSIYGETIAGVPVLRAFGASSKLLRDMLRCVDTNSNPYYWMWGVNRWLSIRFNLLSAGILGAAGLICLVTPSISASLAGFTLAFASTITNDLLFMVRRFVALEQSMVALERVKEYSELKREPPEIIEPRPPASWPSEGEIKVEDLVIRYAPDLPDVLHNLSFTVHPGEKVGILGRTGSGKSTLALSFFRFVEPTSGRILVDDLDISNMGLTDLRSRITIIPQDPTILSGTLRSTLDVFDEYQDPEIYEALRRVHLIPSEGTPAEALNTVNANVFRELDSSVSEGGDNFSTGEKQLLCMARAILKRSKILVMDEATASVDYATDELIGKTIRHEFAESTILTIAHRLRTVIDYDRVMILDQGQILEFDRPGTLLSDTDSKFHALCKATGKDEFATLKKMAGVPA
ncbi:ATP-binding cassette transporter [Coprinopsis marcescibilis]|uniref:ATP-binding cassette transporter n=1 Tax=Coprinopsis marcescibilis TaxID=230819 RepID=A0A5C3KPZ3_COPMA|nr:ATP-binding cassette transporter [Coprinopsis marcescibilis]